MFSLAVGTGALLTFGAYLPQHISIPTVAWAIGFADTAAAILAGLVIFPIVFASGLDAGEEPGLIFVTLPVAFSAMPGGQLVAALFFLLVFFCRLHLRSGHDGAVRIVGRGTKKPDSATGGHTH